MNADDANTRCPIITAAFSNRLNGYIITPSIAPAVRAPLTLQQPFESSQSLTVNGRRIGPPHHGAQRLVEHPARNLERPPTSVLFEATAVYRIAGLRNRRTDRDATVKQGMPGITNYVEIGNMALGLTSSITRSDNIVLSATSARSQSEAAAVA